MMFDSTIALFLIGTSVTALVSLFAAVGTQSQPKHLTLPLHFVIVGIYLPMTAVAVNMAPLTIFANKATALLTLGLSSMLAVASHALWAVTQQLRRITRAAPDVTDPPMTTKPTPPRGRPAVVLLNSSLADYRNAVISAETNGRDFAYVQRRIAPFLNTDEMLRMIASQRFGAGNAESETYVSSHQSRRQAFLGCLSSGAQYRELFNREVLTRYVETGTHAENMWPLPPATIVSLLNSWRDVLMRYPNYYVGISHQALPLKYHIIDRECVILHEPIGKGDDIRLNSLFVYSKAVGTIVANDFDLVWGLIDPEWRDRQRIAHWITEDLIPLARRRGEKASKR